MFREMNAVEPRQGQVRRKWCAVGRCLPLFAVSGREVCLFTPDDRQIDALLAVDEERCDRLTTSVNSEWPWAPVLKLAGFRNVLAGWFRRG